MRARLAIWSLLVLAPVARAQRVAPIDLTLPPASELTTLGPEVVVHGVLSDPGLRGLVEQGFPARLFFRVELWPRGLFKSRADAVEWDVVVSYDPLSKLYTVTRRLGAEVSALGSFADMAKAEAAVSAPYRPPIAAKRSGDTFYYSCILEVQAMNMTDLDEVNRWLKGDFQPAVHGKLNPGTALVRGFQRLFVRMLGGETSHYEGRTDTFRPT